MKTNNPTRLLWITASVACLALLAPAARIVAGPVNMAWSTVGSPGNAPDPSTNHGEVDYTYNIGTYDVTTGQYAAFLNAVAASDPYGVWNPDMVFFHSPIGIVQNGAPGSYTYSVMGNPNIPMFSVTWGDAARFANWMNNGQPTGAEGSATTETGAYTLNGATSDSALAAVTRNPSATIFLPSADEWYKAAFYNPANASYWLYPTQSNSPPSNVLSATGTNNANFFDGFSNLNGGYTEPVNYLTPVGSFAGSPGPFGTYDMCGDVFQWNDEYESGLYRDVRGGSWDSQSDELVSSYFANSVPTYETGDTGFRLASVPEPSAFALLFVGICALLSAKQVSRFALAN